RRIGRGSRRLRSGGARFQRRGSWGASVEGGLWALGEARQDGEYEGRQQGSVEGGGDDGSDEHGERADGWILEVHHTDVEEAFDDAGEENEPQLDRGVLDDEPVGDAASSVAHENEAEGV